MAGSLQAPGPPIPMAEVGGRADPVYLRAAALVVLAGTCWSLAGLLVRAIDEAGTWRIILWRSLFLVATLLIVIGLRSRWRIVAAFRNAGFGALLAGLCIALASILFVTALRYTTVANTVFLLGATPFLTALLGRLVLGERVRPATWLAMSGALAGVGVMVLNGIAIGNGLGNAAALGACFGFAGFTILIRRGREVDMLPATAWAGLLGACISLTALGFAGERIEGGPHDLALCALMGVVQLGLGLVCYTFGARHLPAPDLVLLSMIELVLAPIWVWLGFAETPTIPTLVGGAIIVLAITCQALSGTRRKRPAAGPL